MNEDLWPEHIPHDLVPTDEVRLRVEELSPEQIARMDNWLLSFATYRSRKVAYLVMSAMAQLHTEIPGVPDSFYICRVQKLIEDGYLLLDGNMEFWRQSEVLLPPGGIKWK